MSSRALRDQGRAAQPKKDILASESRECCYQMIHAGQGCGEAVSEKETKAGVGWGVDRKRRKGGGREKSKDKEEMHTFPRRLDESEGQSIDGRGESYGWVKSAF